MIRHRIGVAVIMTLAWAALSVHAQEPPPQKEKWQPNPMSAKGSEARVYVQGDRKPVTVKGELLGVDSNHVWLLADKRTTTISRASVLQMRVKVHRNDGKRGITIGLLSAGVSGVLLTAACSSVEDANCGGIVIIEGLWLLVAGIAALFMEASSWLTLPLDNWAQVAAYARFPQGVPPSMTAEPYAGKP